MRVYACLTLVCCCAASIAQLRPEENKALSDALFLNNLSLSDLNFARRTDKVAYALPLANSAVDKPLETTDALMALHEKALSIMPSELIRTARIDMMDDETDSKRVLAITNEPQIPEVIPAEARPVVRDLAEAVDSANAAVYSALSALTPVEKRTLIDSLPGWAIDKPLTRFEFQLTVADSQQEILRLLAKVDLPLIRYAAEKLAQTTEKDLPQLETIAKTTTWKGSVSFNFGSIKVEVGGVGENFHDGKGAQLVIDFGGDNRYAGRAGAGVLDAALLVDCGSKGVFQQKDIGAGCGFLGVGLAYLLGDANDLSAGSLAMGSGLGGVGILYANKAGNQFNAGAMSEGFGSFGIGALIERGGNSHFSATGWSQGAASTAGIGWLVATSGANEMDLTGIADADLPKTFCGQGYASGANELGGGVALLSMGSGDETLIGGDDCQASANRKGLASLYQQAGGHQFIAGSRAQGCAENESAAYLFSMNGDGSFVLRGGEGQAFAANGAVAFLLDRSGSNTYFNLSGAPSTAISKGLAIFLHGTGKDHYSADLAASQSNEGLALSVDMDAVQGGFGSVKPGIAISLDQELTKHVVGAQFIARSQVRPGSVSLPTSGRLEALYGGATSDSSTQEEFLAIRDQFVAFGIPGFEWLLQVKLANANEAGESLIGSVARSIGQGAKDELALKIADASDALALHALRICMQQNFKEAGVLVGGALTRPTLQREAAIAAGEFQAKDTVSTLMVLAGQQDEVLVLNAARSLATLGDPSSLATGQALLGSNDLLIREAAVNLIAATSGGFDIAKALSKDSEEKTARTGIQILSKIGSPAALDLAGQGLSDARSGVRIQALLALNGRVPDKYKPKVEDLKQDPSALVRAVVAGMAP